MITFLVTLGDP